MAAATELHRLEIETGGMNAVKFKQYSDRQAKQLIEILVLEGKHPKPDKEKRRFYKGTWS